MCRSAAMRGNVVGSPGRYTVALWGTKTQADLTATAKRNRDHMSRPSGSRVAEPRGCATARIRSNIRAPQPRSERMCLCTPTPAAFASTGCSIGAGEGLANE